MAVNRRLAFPPVVPLCAVKFNLVRSQPELVPFLNVCSVRGTDGFKSS